ncbi:MAG: DUF998 domain-containing protein [Caldilineaceae bacterium]|nr:DUF998 domain-containing protein [Caldilineaceae bacterium]
MESGKVIQHRTLRLLLGVLGMLLPLVLVGGGYLAGDGVLPTLSTYYHSQSPILHGFFVGTVFSVGAFLFCYKGYEEKRWGFLGDNWTANVAGIGAFFTAIFPTASVEYASATYAEKAFSVVHNISTLVFLLASAAMVLLLFTRTKKDKKPDDGKKKRNCIYRTCGRVMVAGTVALVILFLTEYDIPHALLGLESVVIFAFGVAWFVKAIRRPA